MNIIKKMYCRIYQTAFHIALPILPYREPEILKNVTGIASKLKELGLNSVLIVTDGILRNCEGVKKLENSLAEQNISYVFYDKTNQNPTVLNVEEGLKIYKDSKCDALIAFGGGSPMDCAKGIGARVAYPKKTLGKLKGTLRVLRKIPPLFAVPTTAGTGSEVTLTAVITDSGKKHKYTLNSFPLIPRYAVLDPEVTYSLPQHLTSTTGMDALTHAVEAYIGNSTSRETRKLAEEAVKLIFENIENAYKNPTDKTARENMLCAAYKAGIAFSKSYVGYVHAIAHSLGGQYNVPHGLANSVLLPVVLEEYSDVIYKKLKKLAIAGGIACEKCTEEDSAKKFIAKIKELNENMNIKKSFSEIQESDIPIMAKHAEKEANPLYPVPKLMTRQELEQIYYKVAELKK